MAFTFILQKIVCVSLPSQKCYGNQTVAPAPSQLLSSESLSKLKKQCQVSAIKFKKLKCRKTYAEPVVVAAQSNFLKAIQNGWKVARDVVEAGTNLVPDFVPRPIAKLSVTGAAVILALFVLKSFLSTAFFVLAMMGVIYFTFIALNKDEGPKGGGGTTSTEDPLEEARRIMEKYK